MNWRHRKSTPTYMYAVLVVLSLMVLAKIILSYYESSNPLPHRTLAIIKPDAVAAGNAENIIKQIDNNGFKIVAQKQVTIDKDTAAQFYEVHKNKPFFGDLIAYITSGPSVVLVLERLDAVHAWRNLMGATDPQKADPGTVRQLYGTDIQRNAVHGSDSKENAQTEIKLFFPELQ